MNVARRAGAVGLVTALAGLSWWLVHRESPQRRTTTTGTNPAEQGAGASAPASVVASGIAGEPETSAESAPPAVTAFDRAKRDAMRELIWRAFGQEAPPRERPEPRRTYVLPKAPPPDPPGDAGSIDATYIRDHVRSEFFGPASQCYVDAVKRLPDARGQVVFWFTIVGDEKVGGIVESVDVLDESTLRDPEMIECMRESFLSVTFPPPKGGGFVTVKYPVAFAPDDDQ